MTKQLAQLPLLHERGRCKDRGGSTGRVDRIVVGHDVLAASLVQVSISWALVKEFNLSYHKRDVNMVPYFDNLKLNPLTGAQYPPCGKRRSRNRQIACQSSRPQMAG